MARILHISASPRGERSNSRKLGGEFLATWLAAHPGDSVTERDVGHNPPAHVTEAWVAAAFTPVAQHTPAMTAVLAESDALVEELLAHDVIVVSSPMYNFGVPSTLKAYVDNVVRIGKTFAMDAGKPNPYVQLVHGKKLFVLTARGGAGYGPGAPMAGYNHEATYLQAIFGFMGVTDSTVISHENANAPPPASAAGRAAAQEAIEQVVAS